LGFYTFDVGRVFAINDSISPFILKFYLGTRVLARLISLPNVLIASHLAFLPHEALANIAKTTLETVSAFERGGVPEDVLVKL
jgi:lactate dehydrogenase-like 2-hydroxyacid dehydrogenase